MAIFGGRRLTRTGILFVIGIVVLAGLVTGAVFLVKGRGEQVRRDEAVKIAEQNLKEQSDGVVSQADQDAADDAAKAKAEADAKAAEEAKQAKAAQDAAIAAADPAQLPQTGPADDFGRVLIVTILATSVAFYVGSRRAAQQG